MVIFAPAGPSDGVTTNCGPVAETTVKTTLDEPLSPKEPFTVTKYELPVGTLATTKKVPARVCGGPCVRTHADDLKRPVGLEEIVQEEESPLLNAPVAIPTVTVEPGEAERGVSTNIGVASTMKLSEAVTPLLLVTVTVNGLFKGVAPLATVNEAVILPVPIVQLGFGEEENRVAEDVRVQLESRLGKPVPVTVILVPTGPSEGLRNMAGPANGAATVNVAEAVSPRVPLIVTVKLLPDATFATTKNVPVRSVPPEPILHADDAKRPPGAEVIEQVTEPIVSSPLLNCPPRTKVIVLPGGSEADGRNVRVGEPSTVKDTLAGSPPGVPVTVIKAPVLATTATPT